jgi:hypothetical protein
MTEHLTIASLLAELRGRGLLDAGRHDQAAAQLSQAPAAGGTPWMIQALVACGAWLSGCFLVAFLFATELLRPNKPEGMIACGVILLIAAVTLHSLGLGVFGRQLALALSVAAHALLLTGIGIRADAIGAPAVAACALALILYPLVRDALHRTLSSLLAVLLLAAWIIQSGHLMVLHGLIGLVLLVLAALVERRLYLTSGGALLYAAAVAYPLLLVLGLFPARAVHLAGFSWWPTQVSSAVWLGWVCWRAWRASGGRERGPLLWAGAAVLLLGAVSTPGVLAAIGLLVVGYLLPDLLVGLVGLLFCPVFITFYYYQMHLRLDRKSFILAASGLALLLGRWLFARGGGKHEQG